MFSQVSAFDQVKKTTNQGPFSRELSDSRDQIRWHSIPLLLIEPGTTHTKHPELRGTSFDIKGAEKALLRLFWYHKTRSQFGIVRRHLNASLGGGAAREV